MCVWLKKKKLNLFTWFLNAISMCFFGEKKSSFEAINLTLIDLSLDELDFLKLCLNFCPTKGLHGFENMLLGVIHFTNKVCGTCILKLHKINVSTMYVLHICSQTYHTYKI